MAANAGWWGFRLRVPPGYVPKPVSIVDRLAAGFVVAGILETACLAVLVLWPGIPAASYRTWAPLWLTVLPLLPCLAMPATFLEQSGVAAWMVLAREKGSLSRTDPWLALVCVIALILARFRSLGSIQFALDVTLADSAAALLFLILQERITIHWKRWAVSIPDWLRRNLEDEERKKVRDLDREDTPLGDAVIPPDSGAQPIFNLNVSAGASYPVGIQIPDDVLGCLRKLNTDAHGTLYQSEPQAVVLMDRPPVEHAGRQEILRLCAQILSIARKHQWPLTARPLCRKRSAISSIGSRPLISRADLIRSTAASRWRRFTTRWEIANAPVSCAPPCCRTWASTSPCCGWPSIPRRSITLPSAWKLRRTLPWKDWTACQQRTIPASAICTARRLWMGRPGFWAAAPIGTRSKWKYSRRSICQGVDT